MSREFYSETPVSDVGKDVRGIFRRVNLARIVHQTAYVLYILCIHAFIRLFVFCRPLFVGFFLT